MTDPAATAICHYCSAAARFQVASGILDGFACRRHIARLLDEFLTDGDADDQAFKVDLINVPDFDA